MNLEPSTSGQASTSKPVEEPSVDPKSARKSALANFTRIENQLLKEINAQKEAKLVTGCKAVFDTAYDKCLSACNEFLAVQAEVEKPKAQAKIDEVKSRYATMNERYQSFLSLCVTSASPTHGAPSVIGSRHSGSVSSQRSRGSVEALKVQAEQVQKEAELSLRQLEIQKQQEEEEAEEEVREAEAKAREAEARARRKKRTAALKSMGAQIELEKEVTRAQSKVLEAEADLEGSVFGSDGFVERPSISLRQFASPAALGIDQAINSLSPKRSDPTPILVTQTGPVYDSTPIVKETQQSVPRSQYLPSYLAQDATLPRITIDNFNGDILEYDSFIMQFDEFIDCKISDDGAKLQFLLKYCTGEAFEAIKGCKVIRNRTEAYREARSRLDEKFRASDLIMEAAMETILIGPPISESDSDAWNKLADSMYYCSCTLNAGGYESELNSRETISKIYRRLPEQVRRDFIKISKDRERTGRKTTFDDLLQFVRELARSSRHYYQRIHFEQCDKKFSDMKGRRFQSKSNRPASKSFNVKEKSSAPLSFVCCPLCRNGHQLWRCEIFKMKTSIDRYNFVKNKRLCFNCLREGHMNNNCPTTMACKTCSKKHHTLLHYNKPQPNENLNAPTNNENAEERAVTACGTQKSKNVKRFKVLPVKVWGSDPNKIVQTYAFLDDGSDTSMCTKTLANQLGLNKIDRHVQLFTANSLTEYDTIVGGMHIQGINEIESFNVDELIVLNDLVDVSESIPTKDVANRYAHLNDLTFPRLKNAKIELLLGNNVHEAFRLKEQRVGKPGQPFGLHTALGWTLFGSDYSNRSDNNARKINFLHSLDGIDASCRILVNSFNQDFKDLNDVQRHEASIEDKRALGIMKSTVKKVDGHYQIGLPWKDDLARPSNNRKMAERRLQYLKKKLQANPELFSRYRDKVTEYVNSGHATMILDGEIRNLSNFKYYIPHHFTGPKFRIVFDCAAKHLGLSLNDYLLQGPDLTNNLVGVLLRFRQEKIALVADIKGMFHQVFVDPNDRDAFRFLWWPENDLSRTPVDYRMNVHIFGATSSPSCAAFALRKTADDNLTGANEQTLSTVRQNFYVDDMLKSCSSVNEALHLLRDIQPLLKSGGFHLTKFISNDKTILASVPSAELASSTLNLDLHELPTERALGVYWDTALDCFKVKVNVQLKPSTRRGILSMVSQVYDPLGFAQPFILPARKLLQEACNSQVGWDDLLPNSHITKWNAWLRNLTLLERISVPRCLKSSLSMLKSIQLHTFCDASSIGYGAVSYLRIVDLHDVILCSFVMGKSRVSPLKPVSTPRLELTAAVIAVKLSTLIQQELEYKLGDIFYWTDSTTVLQYILNTSTRFHTFVANRLEFIHGLSKPCQWRHVDTKRNPADIASRGLMPDKVDKAEIWFNGPQFLGQVVNEWPARPQVLPPLANDDPELKQEPAKCNFTKEISSTGIERLFSRYSSFSRLQRCVAWLLRYKQYLRWKAETRNLAASSTSFNTNFLSRQEIDAATTAIVHAVQHDVFPEVIKLLSNHENFQSPVVMSKGELRNSKVLSSLQKLSPILVNNVIYVGGRLQKSLVDRNAKHQMILPSNHPVTALIISSHHIRQGHSGTLHVVASIRESFWILRGQAAVRKVLRNCRQCRRWNAKIGEQMMAALPSSRVTANRPPFTCVGVDYMGPIPVKLGRSQVKRYACVFTCMATRAVHIEVAQSLETSAFIDAYRRFISRRPTPKQIFSDNGTNFVGAERELRMGIRKWNKKQMHDAMLQNEIDWRFNPPAASHQGGVWERIIRTVRKIIRSITGERVLDDYGLMTLLTEVERILNNRPLTPISDDPRDLETLSPSMVLKGAIDMSLPPGEFIKADGYKKSWRLTQLVVDQFWTRWIKEYLPLLQLRQKWLRPVRNFAVGDVVLIVDDTIKRGYWPKGIIEQCESDCNGLVRRVRVKTATTILWRDIRKLCLLEAQQ